MQDKSKFASEEHQIENIRSQLETVLSSEVISPESKRAVFDRLDDFWDICRKIAHAKVELTSAMDAVQDPLFIHDREYRVVRANKAYAKRAGVSVDHVVGTPYWKLFPPIDGPFQGNDLNGDRSEIGEEELTLESGEIFHVRHFPILDGEESLGYVLHLMRDVTEKRRAEAEQRTLSEVIRQATEAVLVLSQKGEVRYFNPAFQHLFGYTKAETIGKSITAIFSTSGTDTTQPSQVLEALFSHGKWKGELLRQAKDGTAIPVLLSASVLKDSQGNVTGFVGNYLDLREIKSTERKLRESEEQFRAMTTAAQDAMLVLDDDGNIVFWNDAAERILGYSTAEAVGKNAHNLLAPKHYLDAYKQAWPVFAKSGKGSAIGKVLELEALRKNGEVFPIELSVSAFSLRGRWHAVGIMRDITQRKEAEERLSLFRNLLDQSTDGVYIVEPTTSRFIDVNDAACKDLGYMKDELLQLGVLDIQNDIPNVNAWQAHLKELQKHNVRLLNFYAVRKDRSTFPVEVSTRNVLIEDKAYIIAIVRDVSERRTTEIALRNSLRAQRTLAVCNKILIHVSDERQLITDMCHTLVEEGGYDLAWIGFLEQDENSSIRPVAYAGNGESHIDALNNSWGDNEHGKGPTGRAARLGTLQVEQSTTPVKVRDSKKHAKPEQRFASSIVLPLKEVDGKTYGVLNIYSSETQAFDDDEINLLQQLADDLSFGLLTLRTRQERDHFQKQHIQSAYRLKESLVDTIRAVAMTVEKRDPYTAGHQSRVADLSVAIGKELGLDNERIEGLHLGAMIHDIGKIYIPAEILNRPGHLSVHEFGMIKTHSDVGYDIIKNVKFPWPVAEMVLQHHERMDGSGYPNGLKGEDIILEARIIAVADVVEAITAHRPYRPALGIDKALDEIESKKGLIYDREVANSCIRLFREKGYYFTD